MSVSIKKISKRIIITKRDYKVNSYGVLLSLVQKYVFSDRIFLVNPAKQEIE